MRKCRIWWYYWRKEQSPTKHRALIKAHFKGKSYIVHKIICWIPCQTKSRKKNPRLVMEAWSNRVTFYEAKGNNCLKERIVHIE